MIGLNGLMVGSRMHGYFLNTSHASAPATQLTGLKLSLV